MVQGLSVKIGDLDLINRTEDSDKKTISELRSVSRISTQGRRQITENEIIGGGFLWDTGRNALRVKLEGEFAGVASKDSVTALRKMFLAQDPVEFTSDLSSLVEIQKVLIQQLQISQLPGELNRYRYHLSLLEYVEPPPEEEEPAAQEDKETEKESEIDDIRGRILDADGKPAKGVTVKISGPEGEKEAKTNDNGYYEVQDLSEGKYEITVDQAGYEEQKSKIEIKKGTGETGGGAEGGESQEDNKGEEMSSEGGEEGA